MTAPRFAQKLNSRETGAEEGLIAYYILCAMNQCLNLISFIIKKCEGEIDKVKGIH